MEPRIMLMTAITVIALASSSLFAGASDPSNVADYCVAIDDSKATVFVNGKICKNPKDVVVDDFYLQANFHVPRNTSNSYGSLTWAANVQKLPGLNTLGLTVARTDIGPYGVNPPHSHLHGSEVIVVMEGTLYVGFVESRNYKLFAKILNQGDVFVFPKGLIHFMYNLKGSPAVIYAALGTQAPSSNFAPHALFGTDPPIMPDVLTKSFQLDRNVVTHLQSQYWEDVRR